MKKTRLLVAVAAIGAATILLAACGSSSNNSLAGASPNAPSPTTARGPSATLDTKASALVPASFKTKGFISVASDIPYAPMEFSDAQGNLTGLDYDLSQALATTLGIKFNFEKQAFDTIIPSLQAGRHDIIMSGMNDTKVRQQLLDFVEYFKGGFSILVKKGNPEGIKTLLDLCGKSVAVEAATVQIDLLKAASKTCPSGQIKVLAFPQDPDAENAVRAGKATADVLDAAVAGYNAKTAGAGQYFEVVKDAANPAGYESVFTGIGVLKKDSALTAALLAGMQTLIANGIYPALLAKYGLSTYSVGTTGINLAK
jgi:polar amino acid transport system substrate-binding protein